jgi:pyruvate kinase
MLESMTDNPRPTRAEASDVANAVLDGADCVMLSGETAKGNYPREAVSVMAQVCKEAEAAIFNRMLVLDMEAVASLPMDPSDSVAKAIVEAASCSEAALIISLTRTGTSARLISKHRPRCPIFVLSSDPHVGAALNLHRGCLPYLCPPELAYAENNEDERFVVALEIAKREGLIGAGDKVVLAHGTQSGATSLTNLRVVVMG